MATPGTVTYGRLASGTFLGTSATPVTIFTAQSGQMGAQITSLLFINIGTVAADASVWLVPSGQSIADHFFLAKNFTIPSDGGPVDIFQFVNGGVYISAADKIQGSASASSAITFFISGAELS